MKNSIINKQEEYSNGKYSILNFTSDKGNATRIVCNQESICIIPFDCFHDESSQIRNVYLAKYTDYVTSEDNHKCITGSLKPDEFNTYHDSLLECIDRELGLSDINVNDLFYLGIIKHSVPFNKSYKCYALDLTKYSNDVSGFIPVLSESNQPNHTIDKVKFNRVINGEISDSLILSGSLLLLSYRSE
jgi:hypothetical protein